MNIIIVQQGQNLAPEEKEKAINSKMDSMSKDAKKLHCLNQKRKTVSSLLTQKNKEIEEVLARDIAERREKESTQRVKNSCAVEFELQQITSALMMELKQICSEDAVPRYIIAIAKILDNYQG